MCPAGRSRNASLHLFASASPLPCRAALALDPKNVKALLRRGTARSVLGAYGEALTDFQSVLVLEPNNRAARDEIDRMRRLLVPTEGPAGDGLGDQLVM